MDLRDTFDSLKDRATDLAQAGVAQSKRAYLEIGKLYYAERGTAPEGAYAAACERITAARAAIETNKERMAQLKMPGDPVDDEESAEEEGEPVCAEEAQEPESQDKEQ